ncbi:MAG: hypothetical protein J4203_03665 [Candidatus Diapherotrites archaeon]|uniref:Uncharacterized protein n=1 Tax=Candidatus Iainarchaeum sp. TaxID=3101447 RepID=A0A8T4LJ87_9ARCH|nr:hypothetical protein [Candidatus Diapherotrites archaeon]
MSKAFSFLGLAAILVVFVIAAGCLNPTPAQPNPGEPGGMCGGIAGIECEEDFVCQYGGNNPDAAGTCVKAEEERPPAEEGEFCGGIAGIPCEAGFECQLQGDYPDAGGTCVDVFARPPKPAQEGERCGGFDSRSCDVGLVCETSAGPPGSLDMDTGSCVKLPNQPDTEGCTLMRNVNTGEVACFGCGRSICSDPSPDFQPLERDPSQLGIPYSCYIDEAGACALAQ